MTRIKTPGKKNQHQNLSQSMSTPSLSMDFSTEDSRPKTCSSSLNSDTSLPSTPFLTDSLAIEETDEKYFQDFTIEANDPNDDLSFITSLCKKRNLKNEKNRMNEEDEILRRSLTGTVLKKRIEEVKTNPHHRISNRFPQENSSTIENDDENNHIDLIISTKT